MIQLIKDIIEDIFYPGRLGGRARSSGWRKARREHIKKFPYCAVTGKTKKLQVHHVIPFHVDPSKELDPTNLMTLTKDMHFHFGHLRNWSSWNLLVRGDAALWREKIKDRP